VNENDIFPKKNFMSRDLNVRMLKLSIYNEIKDQLTQLAHSKKKSSVNKTDNLKKTKQKTTTGRGPIIANLHVSK
jgi:hypothetical protein